MTTPATPLVRPLGLTEAICAEFFDQLPCGLQVVAAARSTALPSRTVLEAAIARARRRHPILSSVLERKADGSWWFAPGSGIAPAPIVREGGSWQERYAVAASTPLDPSQALWRVELVAAPTEGDGAAVLLVTAHHAALDGVAISHLAADLLADPGDDGAPMPPSVAMEDLLRWGDGSTPAPSVAPAGTGWPVEHRAPATARRLALTVRSLDVDVTDALHRRARSAGTTVNAVLMAVLCDVSAAVRPAPGLVGFNVPADLRRRASPPLPADQMGAYFARPHVWAEPETPGTLEERAVLLEDRFSADLAACLAAPGSWQTADVVAAVGALCTSERDRFDADHMLTDLGVIELGPTVDGFWFTTVQTAGAEAVIVSVATVSGCLQLTVAWPEPLLGAHTGHAVADELVGRLAVVGDG